MIFATAVLVYVARLAVASEEGLTTRAGRMGNTIEVQGRVSRSRVQPSTQYRRVQAAFLDTWGYNISSSILFSCDYNT